MVGLHFPNPALTPCKASEKSNLEATNSQLFCDSPIPRTLSGFLRMASDSDDQLLCGRHPVDGIGLSFAWPFDLSFYRFKGLQNPALRDLRVR